MAGLPAKYARMGFKKGWAAFRNSKRKKAAGKPSQRKPRRSRKMPDKKIPIFATAGFAVYGYNAYQSGYAQASYTPQQKFDYTLTNLTGVRVGTATAAGSGIEFDTALFINTWKAPALGTIGSVIARKARLNKYIAKVPLIGEYFTF